MCLAHFARVEVADVTEGTSTTRRKVTFNVQVGHRQTIMDGIQDALPRLHHAGYARVGVLVPQRGHLAKHGTVFEHRKVGEPCRCQYSCEWKLRSCPAHRREMRKDCAGLFQAACNESTQWLGQIIVCIEITSDGNFLQTRAELLVRGRSRDEPINLWGWQGAPCLAPPRPNLPVARVHATAAPKAAARPPPVPAPMRAAPPPKRPFATVWSNLRKYNASWTTDRVVLLKQFFVQMGPRFRGNVTNCSRVVKENRNAPLSWRVACHYHHAFTAAEGRVGQGGAVPPIIVSKTALKAYYGTL